MDFTVSSVKSIPYFVRFSLKSVFTTFIASGYNVSAEISAVAAFVVRCSVSRLILLHDPRKSVELTF